MPGGSVFFVITLFPSPGLYLHQIPHQAQGLGHGEVVEGVDKRMDFEYFRNLTRAAGVRLKEGAKKSDVVPEIHETLPLGTLVKQGRAWEKRMKVARNKLEKKLGRKLSEEE